jgi:hypothetical protein
LSLLVLVAGAVVLAGVGLRANRGSTTTGASLVHGSHDVTTARAADAGLPGADTTAGARSGRAGSAAGAAAAPQADPAVPATGGRKMEPDGTPSEVKPQQADANTAPSTAGGQPLDDAASSLMLAQVPLDKAADRIERAAAGSDGGTGLGGFEVSAASRVLTVYWKGTVPTGVADVVTELRGSGVDVAVKSAPFTQRELRDRAKQILSQRGMYQSRGFEIDSVAIRTDAGGLDVGGGMSAAAARTTEDGGRLPALDGTDAGRRIPAWMGGSMRPVPYSRLSDGAPHSAGARIVSNQASCTTGFPISLNADQRTFILTAGHCGTGIWSAFNAGEAGGNANTGSPFVFGSVRGIIRGLDVEFIRSNAVAGTTYDGGVATGTDLKRPIAGASANRPGDLVCISGAWTGAHCGLRVSGEAVFPVNGSAVPMWTACRMVNGACGGVAAGAGDSGGPIFSVATADGQVFARGSESLGLGQPFTCSNNNGESTTCANQIAFVDVNRILAAVDARVVTSGQAQAPAQ